MRHEVLNFSEDYSRLVDLFEAIETNQKESFVLAELGAGDNLARRDQEI
jgi:hypothetical protein